MDTVFHTAYATFYSGYAQLTFWCGTAMDLENVYHVTRIKWLYFANKGFKQKIAYLPQKVAYYLWKTAYTYHKECKSSETNYDILNSNSDLNSDGGTPQWTVRDELDCSVKTSTGSCNNHFRDFYSLTTRLQVFALLGFWLAPF